MCSEIWLLCGRIVDSWCYCIWNVRGVYEYVVLMSKELMLKGYIFLIDCCFKIRDVLIYKVMDCFGVISWMWILVKELGDGFFYFMY